MTGTPIPLRDVTIAIEWENASDVQASWIEASARALAAALPDEASSDPTQKPTLLYLFDENQATASSVRSSLERAAPELFERACVRLVATEGLAYYELKNRGGALAETPFLVLLDSDMLPDPDWLGAILAPFSNPGTSAVSGVTALATRDLVSRTMALVWIFDLPSEHEDSRDRAMIHANNCAFRTDFFQQNPFPNTPAFKKQCGLWLADILQRGFGFVRTPDARCLHAPHSGLRFALWRGFQSGLDRDAKARLEGRGRLDRLGYAIRICIKKIVRSTQRVIGLRQEVRMPLREIPAAIAVAWAYYLVLAAGQISCWILGGAPEAFRLKWTEPSR